MTALYIAMFLVSALGIFSLGIIANLLFWHYTNSFPWQLQIKLLTDLQAVNETRLHSQDEELREIRDTLLGSLKERK